MYRKKQKNKRNKHTKRGLGGCKPNLFFGSATGENQVADIFIKLRGRLHLCFHLNSIFKRSEYNLYITSISRLQCNYVVPAVFTYSLGLFTGTFPSAFITVRTINLFVITSAMFSPFLAKAMKLSSYTHAALNV